MSFSDEDLKRFLEMHGDQPFYMSLLARLEAAEQVIVDIVHPDKGYLDGPPWRRQHYEEWRKSKGE